MGMQSQGREALWWHWAGLLVTPWGSCGRKDFEEKPQEAKFQP